MKPDLIIAIVFAILVHGGFAFSDRFFKAAPPAAPAAEATPVMELVALPPVEPEPPEIVEPSGEASAEIAEMAPPSLADTPSAAIDSSFVQQIQPPPPPGLNRPTGAITIPVGRPAGGGNGSGLGNIFDLASLDQQPVARFQARPVYPIDMRRAGISGEVMVRFVVDADGNVRDAVAVRSSQRDFEQEAVNAVLKWKFRPGKKGGIAVNTRIQIPIKFNLAAE
ncbi:MAG: biopolymer transporter TonB [Rariglobus sp.]|jgi:protein TonB|nr:biopolymer transporter TonB [Rariglobus sp.]